MGVIFGFRAFDSGRTKEIDSIDDWDKTLTNDIFLTVPRSLEELSGYGDAQSHIYGYHEYFKKMLPYGFTESDLDFLMYVDGSAYCDNDICERFFDAGECYKKFIRFTDYFKNFTETRHYFKLLNLETNEYERGSTIWNEETKSYQPVQKLNCEIVYMTLYEYCKKDIDNFADFFLRHSQEGHFVQGYWS